MSVKNYQPRIIRGRILKVLDFSYPYPAGDRLISQILCDNMYQCTPAELQVHLAYLEEKEYIDLTDVASEELGHRKLAKLTAKGKDLLEGSIAADPGVDLNG